MVSRIEVKYKVFDSRAKTKLKELNSIGFKIKRLEIVDVYTIDFELNEKELKKTSEIIHNPLLQIVSINKPVKVKKFDFAIEIGFLPGVTDNVGFTAKQTIEEMLKRKVSSSVFSSQVFFISGVDSRKKVNELSNELFNPLIQRRTIKSFKEFVKEKGMPLIVPRVVLDNELSVVEVDLDVSNKELVELGKKGIRNKNGSRRGPLALSLDYLLEIKKYFKKLGRNPTDIELESLAQTWSEHCKHTIFASPIDEYKNGLFSELIKGATRRIRESKGKNDFCVSVFKDNSGAIEFNKDFLITHKVETHNTPSALDPFGGAVTGIVGVNRDALGFGLGAKPILNTYGFCFADPSDSKPLFKSKDLKQKMLSPKRILEGVIAGVRVGGNNSGIPTPQGFMLFEPRYKGKPLVFVGTVGLIPKKIKNRNSHEKKALPNDLIIMVGGRVGADGVHGATFSSEAIDSNSPVSAVQIGDPITQKKMVDAILEARDKGLYNSITDNGAGGLSSSVSEMALQSGGCVVELDKVPLKYPGLEPWKIWVSESQERMTLAVPEKNWIEFEKIMSLHGVEATIIGRFVEEKKCVVKFNGKKIMDLDMDFLHDGLPKTPLKTIIKKKKLVKTSVKEPENLGNILLELISRKNIASNEFISMQFDHEVQGESILKPLQGVGRVNGTTTISKPLIEDKKGIVLSQGIHPTFSDFDAYLMSANAIDSAVRNNVANGGNLNHMALLDNFCWCDSNNPKRLGELKQAVKACYDYSIIYGTPFISGKDSMFNDFHGFDEKGNPVKISVPPTLLISSISVMNDVGKSVDVSVKKENDLIYVLGETFEELGASEYFAFLSEKKSERIIGELPIVNGEKNKKTYLSLMKVIDEELINSSISVEQGGLGIALTKSLLSSGFGARIDLKKLIGEVSRSDFALFSESSGRILVTVSPKNKKKFEELMKNTVVSLIGVVQKKQVLEITGLNNEKIRIGLNKLMKNYKKTFKGF